jgi:hypothetical protein
VSKPPRWFNLAGFALVVPVGLFAATGSRSEFAAVVFLPLAALAGYWLAAGLTSGVMWTRGGSASRTSEPVVYWFHVALAVVLVALSVGLSVASALTWAR